MTSDVLDSVALEAVRRHYAADMPSVVNATDSKMLDPTIQGDRYLMMINRTGWRA